MIVLLSVAFAQAQATSIDKQIDVESLNHRVDSLEHELSYLKLYYEFYTLVQDIQIQKLDITTQKSDIQFFISNNYYKKAYADIIQEAYESFEETITGLKDRAESQKTLFILKFISEPFTESETEMLSNYCKYLDLLIPTLESSLNSYKGSMDYYIKKL